MEKGYSIALTTRTIYVYINHKSTQNVLYFLLGAAYYKSCEWELSFGLIMRICELTSTRISDICAINA